MKNYSDIDFSKIEITKFMTYKDFVGSAAYTTLNGEPILLQIDEIIHCNSDIVKVMNIHKDSYIIDFILISEQSSYLQLALHFKNIDNWLNSKETRQKIFNNLSGTEIENCKYTNSYRKCEHSKHNFVRMKYDEHTKVYIQSTGMFINMISFYKLVKQTYEMTFKITFSYFTLWCFTDVSNTKYGMNFKIESIVINDITYWNMDSNNLLRDAKINFSKPKLTGWRKHNNCSLVHIVSPKLVQSEIIKLSIPFCYISESNALTRYHNVRFTIPLDPDQKSCVMLREYLEIIDKWISSEEVRKKLFGRRSEKMNYAKCIKKTADTDYVCMHIDFKYFHRTMIHKIIGSETILMNFCDALEFMKEVKFGSEIKIVLSCDKIWGNGRNYGIWLKIISMEYL